MTFPATIDFNFQTLLVVLGVFSLRYCWLLKKLVLMPTAAIEHSL